MKPYPRFLAFFFLSAALLAMSLRASADNPPSNSRHQTESPSGRFVIDMIPEEGWGHAGKGIVYRRHDGQKVRVWETDFYAQEVQLSDSGKHLVRFGPWASDLENLSDLAVAFYERNQLLKEYRVRDLVKNRNVLDQTVSHYQWRPVRQSEPTGFFGDDLFRLVTVDKRVYEFDVRTGAVIKTSVDENAMSRSEIEAARRQRARERAEAMFKASRIHEEFDAHFTLHEAQVGLGSTLGVYFFPKPQWSGDFHPKQPLEHPFMIEAVFPRVDDKLVIALTAEDLLEAGRRAFAHPFVAKRFADGATRLRLRSTGDRLHWDTPELKKMLAQVAKAADERNDLKRWAYFIIDAEEPRYTSIYLNLETGDLLYEEPGSWPPKAVYLPAGDREK